MEDIELHRLTEQPADSETILSPGMVNDVSAIGMFLGIALALALFVNNLKRGYASVAVAQTSWRTILAAAMGMKAAKDAPAAEPAQGPTAAPAPDASTPVESQHDVVVTSTSSATFVFSTDVSKVTP